MRKISKEIIEPTTWGPHFWYFIHTIALCYPNNPSTITKRKYYEFIHNLPLFIPTENISKYFSGLLDKYPVTPYLDNKDSFVKWTIFIHNKVNKKLDKPIITVNKFYSNYKNNNKNRNIKAIEFNKFIKNMYFIIIIIMLSGLIYYLINNK